MREFVQRQRDGPDYHDFVRGKVEAARASMRAGEGRTNDDVEAEFSARRDTLGRAARQWPPTPA